MNNSSKDYPTIMRPGWTMIELIFILVVIGILASVAIGKLSTTRDDAKLSATVSNMNICIKDTYAYYSATGKDYNQTNHPNACDPNNTKCYDFTYAIDGVGFTVDINTSGELYCADIENVGGHLAKTYNFGGSSITR